MAYFQAFILGLIQGICEFLPISSSGHLVLVRHLFNWPDQGILFDALLHLGTLLAVLIYFRKDWLKIIKNIRLPRHGKAGRHRLFWYILLATIPGALGGFAFENIIEQVFRNTFWLSFFFLLTALAIILVDRHARGQKDITSLNGKKSFLIGCAQMIALFPGISRSGSTILAGMLLGLNRPSAARFSFLLSTPIILGAALAAFLKMFSDPQLDGQKVEIIIGFIVSALSGYFVIKFFLKFLEKNRLLPFAYYLVFVSLITLILKISHLVN